MEHMSKNGTFPRCKVVIVLLFFLQSKKNLGVVKLLSVPKMVQMS